jgi:hypothetical protein
MPAGIFFSPITRGDGRSRRSPDSYHSCALDGIVFQRIQRLIGFL